MNKIINTYKNFEKREILDCRIKTFKEMLRHYDFNINSYKTMILCENFTIKYGYLNFKKIGIENLPYALASEDKIEEKIFNTLGVKYKKERIDDSKKSFLKFKNLIDNDTPIMFKMDARFFSASSTTAPREIKINIHYLSVLLLVGYDEQNKKVFILLSNTDDETQPKKISLKNFGIFRGTSCLPFSPDFECLYLDKSTKIKINKEELKIKLIKSLFNISQKMLRGKLDSLILKDFEYKDFKVGINALEAMSKDIQYVAKKCKNGNDQEIKYAKLVIIFLRNNLIFGSYSAFREEFSKCLDDCYKTFKDANFKKISDEFLKISKHWKKIFLYMGKIINAEQKNIYYKILEISDTLNLIRKYEKGAFESLEKIVNVYLKIEENT